MKRRDATRRARPAVERTYLEEALARGEYAAFEMRVGLVFAALGLMLGTATMVFILAQPG